MYGIRRRYKEHRELAAKIVCLLYNVFNALVAFPRVLAGIAPGTGLCNAAWVLRYCNAQPLLTSNVVSMVRCCSLVQLQRRVATQQSGYHCRWQVSAQRAALLCKHIRVASVCFN